jgi:putative two-component system response regulator
MKIATITPEKTIPQMDNNDLVIKQKARILVIDDEPIVRITIEGLLQFENVELLFAEDGINGLRLANQFIPDAILLDLMMPDMNGYEVCKNIRANSALAEVPLIMITAADSREARLEGLSAGADDFLTKPFDSLELRIKVMNILRLNRFRHIKEQKDQLKELAEDLLNAYDQTIEGWSKALDMRDRETEGHSLRVTEKCLELAKAAGIDDGQLIHIRRGALLHDIGKMGIPDAILLKPGQLTENEWAVMRMHPVYAYEWLSQIEYLVPALDIPYCHHERWDGSGYPRGLAGEEIPLAARIFSIIDVWDAMCTERPYRKALSEETVKKYLLEHKGLDFDPHLVDIFLNHF